MPAEFQIVNERVVITKYFHPFRDSGLSEMITRLEAYAKEAPQTILAIADCGGVRQFPSSLLSTGLREGDVNPVRIPKIDSNIVISDSAFLASLSSVVSRVTGIKKIVFVRTRAEADKAMDSFIKKGSFEYSRS